MPSLAENIVKALGLDPAQLRTALQGVMQTAQRVDANLAGTQDAVNRALAHFNGRLDAIERRMSVFDGFNANQTPALFGPKFNGAAQHDGSEPGPRADQAGTDQPDAA